MFTRMKNKSRAPWAVVVFVMAVLMLLLLPLAALAQDPGADTELTPAIGINWPQFHYDEANTGYTPAKAPDTSDLAWESEAIGAAEHSQPVIAWSKAFVYCGNSVKALNRFTGDVMWGAPVKEGAWDSWSSPAYHWGKVFIGSNDTIYCLSASNGRVIWETALPDGLTVVNSSPTVAEGKVFIGAYDMWSEDTGTYFALDKTNGSILWSKAVGDYAQFTPAYSEGKIYVGAAYQPYPWERGKVFCLNSTTGEEIWQQETSYGVWGSVAAGDKLVYAPTYNFYGLGKLYALSKEESGNIQWEKDISSTDATPALAYNKVYISSGYPHPTTPWAEVKTYCFDAQSGELVWEKQDVGGWTCSPAVADNKVFVGKIKMIDWLSVYEATYALNAHDGSLVWDSPCGGSSPAVVFHKRAYTISDGKVYSFRSLWLKLEAIVDPEETQELKDR